MATDAAMLEKVKALLAALPAEDQAELRRYLADILVTEAEAERIVVASVEERTPAGRKITYTYRTERVRCGKEGCWCAQAPLGHGPYTYKYWKEGGRLRKEYVGKGGAEQPIPRSGRRRGGRGRDNIALSSDGPKSPA